MSPIKPTFQFNLGYALGGGGTRGFAHIGALKALNECGMKPEIIVGTSAGALAGVFYADGFEPEEIYELFIKKDFLQLAKLSLPNAGLLKSTGLYNLLKSNLRSKKFEQLKTPFMCVATDWVKGESVTFSEGDQLVESVVASCSVPIIFQPQYINGVAYVDGGVFKNFPVSLIRKQCKYVVGVNVSKVSPLKEMANLIKMSEQTFRMMANANTLLDRDLADILIEPPGVNNMSMFDMKNIAKIEKIGYLSTHEIMQDKKYQTIVKRCLRYEELRGMVKKYIDQTTI